MADIKHFLLVFDHRQGRLLDERHFGTDADEALVAYAAREREHQDDKWIEIVLIGSD